MSERPDNRDQARWVMGEWTGGTVVSLLSGGGRGTVRSVHRKGGYRADAVPFECVWGSCIHLMVQSEGGALGWAEKQKIKSELAGAHRLAVEVFPPEVSLVDQADVFHLWVLPDGFQLPFGLEES